MKKIFLLRMLALVFLFTAFPFPFVTGADAHRSGCHRWHSCPSDTGSYSMEFDSSGDTVPYCGSSMYLGTDGHCHYYTTKSAPSPAISTPTYTYTAPTLKLITGGYLLGTTLVCDVGYYKNNSECSKAPANSTAFGSENFYCNNGYIQVGDKCELPHYQTPTIAELQAQIASLLATITSLQEQIAKLQPR